MRIAFLALYAGPDQIMVATSALATVVGFVLMLWNRLIAIFGKLLNHFRRTPEPAETSAPIDPQNKA